MTEKLTAGVELADFDLEAAAQVEFVGQAQMGPNASIETVRQWASLEEEKARALAAAVVQAAARIEERKAASMAPFVEMHTFWVALKDRAEPKPRPLASAAAKFNFPAAGS